MTTFVSGMVYVRVHCRFRTGTTGYFLRVSKICLKQPQNNDLNKSQGQVFRVSYAKRQAIEGNSS